MIPLCNTDLFIFIFIPLRSIVITVNLKYPYQSALFNTERITALSFSISMGFAMCPFMPASNVLFMLPYDF